MLSEWQLRRDIVACGRRAHEQGLVAASDGNISVRLGRERILITPSGTSLGELKPEDLVMIDAGGRKLTGGRRPSSEYRLHLMVYEVRADVNAIVHAHPPIANSFSFAGLSLDACVIPEVVATLGRIPTTEYATPSTEEGATVARDLIRTHDAILLQRHGSVTVGADLGEAYHRLEKVEHTAKVLLAARTLGSVRPLSRTEIERLARLREQLGWGRAEDVLRLGPPGAA